MPTPQNALKLSAWIAVHEPALFRRLLVMTQNLQRSPLGRFGYFGDNGDIPEVTVTADAVPPPSFDFTVPDPTLTDINLDPNAFGVDTSVSDSISSAIASPSVDSSTADASQTSGSFWGSLGSSVSNIAGAVSKVASGLLSPQTLAAAGTATAAYFNSQARAATNVQALGQQAAAVNAQLARVNAGLAPAPIAYTRDPVTGAVTPVYASNQGPVPLTPGVLSQLTSSTGLSPTLLIGGGIALAIVVALLASR